MVDIANKPETYNSSRDGNGAGDHDEPFRFGRVPRVRSMFPFNERQFVRLQILRSRLHAQGHVVEERDVPN